MSKLLKLSFIFTLFVFIACSDEDDKQTISRYTTSEGSAQIITEEVASYIIEVGPEDSYLVFKSDTPNEYLPKDGEIICSTITQSTPIGFLGKAIKNEKIETGIKVSTEPVAIDQAFEYLSVSETLDITNKLVSLEDGDGNPVEFEILETESEESGAARAWSDTYTIKFDVKYPKGSSNLYFEGKAYASIGLSADIDVNRFSLEYAKIGVQPKVGISGKFVAEVESKLIDKDYEIYKMRFAAIPVGPVVLTPLLKIDFNFKISGKISYELEIEYKALDGNYQMEYRNGTWTNITDNKPKDNSLVANKIEMNGEASLTLKTGVLMGVYGQTVGIGFTIPTSLKLVASFSFLDFNIVTNPPKLTFSRTTGAEAYFIAKIFGWNLAKYTVATREVVLSTRDYSIFPVISDFRAYGESNKGFTSMSVNPTCLLNSTYGVTLFDSKEEKCDQEMLGNGGRTFEKMDRCSHTFESLQSGDKYFTAPTIKFGEYEWHGDKVPLDTDGRYEFRFRCVNQSYDVIIYPFDLDSSSDNSIFTVYEGQDYNNGSYFSATISAKLNKETNIFEGTVDFYFHGDPGQRRTDGFSIPLSDDTGYNTANKIVNNNGCTAAVRFVNISTAETKVEPVYHYISSDYDCDAGLAPSNSNNGSK